MLRLVLPILAALICLPALAETVASDRVALVIGMSRYETVPQLRNTVNDAEALASTLEGLGFEVDRLIDAPRAEVEEELKDFAFRSETADLALIYYAGHGVSVQGSTFLVPVDAEVRAARDIVTQAVTLDDFLRAVDGARKMRIVILDSCRDNPFPDVIDLRDPEVAKGLTTGAGGLARPEPDRGTLVAYAARDGEVALDGAGLNSPFNTALRENMSKPDLEISLLFRQVRDDVLAMTGNQQEPATYGSLPGQPFYLAGSDATREAMSVADLAEAWSRIAPDKEEQWVALAKAGDTRSMFGLAFSKLNPESDKFDPAAAAELLEQAAASGDPESQFQLARLYERGMGVPQDLDRALALYQAAAAQDFPSAVNEIGFFYFNGALGLPLDQAEALKQFQRAADLKQPEALFNVASFADDGLIPGLGPEEAAGYLYQALRSGSREVLDALINKSSSFKIETRKALQQKLAENGLYDGAIDGDFGKGTQRSIRRAYGIIEVEN
ncbi:MAG: caspase family protein [Paracoccaceae bacterium]